MAIYPFREANPSSQKQKFATDNFSGTLANSSRVNPKIRHVFRSHKNTAFVPYQNVYSLQLSAH
jgi:hypothetical protein